MLLVIPALEYRFCSDPVAALLAVSAINTIRNHTLPGSGPAAALNRVRTRVFTDPKCQLLKEPQVALEKDGGRRA